jgi:hypothetical protein
MMTAKQQQEQDMPEPIIMWRADWSIGTIDQVECSKMTDKSVFIVAEPNWWGTGICKYTKPNRCNIVSEYRSFHKTWQEAHAALLAKAEIKLNGCRRRLERLQGEYGNIKGMKPPADAEVQP